MNLSIHQTTFSFETLKKKERKFEEKMLPAEYSEGGGEAMGIFQLTKFRETPQWRSRIIRAVQKACCAFKLGVLRRDDIFQSFSA